MRVLLPFFWVIIISVGVLGSINANGKEALQKLEQMEQLVEADSAKAAMKSWDEVFNTFEAENNKEGITRCLMIKGKYLMDQWKIDEAMHVYREASKYGEQ
ncbi:MAG: hypothetical protein AAFO07_15030, partial [Bacteroidota bacterium]